MTGYWITSIFVFLINVSYFKGVPTAVTRFWRRGIMLFWGIELFLCACFIFVILNCAVETEWLARQSQLLLSTQNLLPSITNQILYCVLLILFSIYLLRSSNLGSSVQNIGVFFVFFLSVFNLTDEFYQFFYHVISYFQYQYSYDSEEMVWEYSSNNSPSLILKQYYFLVVFLKFWHAFLVYVGFIYTLRLLSIGKFTSLNKSALKLSVVNFNFLLIFSLLPFLYNIKLILQVFGTYVYFWFGIGVSQNISLSSLFFFLI